MASWPLSVAFVYFACAVAAVAARDNSSHVFLAFIAYLAIVLCVRISLRPAEKNLNVRDGILFVAPVVLSTTWSNAVGIYEPQSFQYLVLYLAFGMLITFSSAVGYLELRQLARGYVFICLLLIGVGIVALATVGVFTPFQILNLHDPSLSKNVFCAMLLAALGLAASQEFFGSRFIRIFMTAVITAAIIATESRAGLVALAVTAILWQRSAQSYFLVFGLLVGAAGTIFVFDYYYLDGSLLGRLDRLVFLARDFVTGNLSDDGNLDYRRVTLFLAGWRGFLEQPVFGWGAGQDAVAISHTVTQIELASTATLQHIMSLAQGAHNQFLKNLIEYGVLSLLWLYLYVGIARRLASRPKLFSSFVGLLAFAMTNSVLTGLSVFPVFWLYLALSRQQEVRSDENS